MSLWTELKRRNVLRVGIAYLAAVWLLLQVASVILPSFDAPAWLMQALIVAAALGFPVAILLAWFYEVTPTGIQADSGTEDASQFAGRRLDYAIIGLLVLVVAFLVVDDDLRDVEAGPPRSLAVLPFENLSPDPSHALYAAGMHDAVINQLSKLTGLRVLSRDAVLRYADSRPPPDEIASFLNVQSILLGTFQYVNARIRVALQLVDPHSGANLWVEEYQEDFADVFDVQSDIAMSVANALAIRFSVDEQRAIQRAPTNSIEAYDFYLQGQSMMGRDVPQALRYLDEALGIDPQFALAHALKAFLHAESVVNTPGQDAVSEADRQQRIELAQQHARRAIESDRTLAMPYRVLAQLDIFAWRWTDAMARLDEAASNWGVGGSVQARPWLHSYLGEHERAISIAANAVSLDPNSWGARWTLACTYAFARDWPEARRVQLEAIALAPVIPILHYWLAYIEIALGNEADALESLRRAERLMADNRDIVYLPELAYAYWRVGSLEDAARIQLEIDTVTTARDIGTGSMAMASLAKGDREGAINWLEAAVDRVEAHEIDQGFYNLINLKFNVTNDPILEEPVFAALRSRIRGD